jgi:hypothetical protein
MLRFKQFLLEGVEDQIKRTQKSANLLGRDLAKNGVSSKYRFDGIDTYAFVLPSNEKSYGNYSFVPKGVKLSDDSINPDDFHRIRVYTDNHTQITNPASQQNSTLRHELQHLWQRSEQLKDNPQYVDKKNTKYNNIRPREGLDLNSSEYLKNEIGKDLSYRLDPQEVNARGIQRAGDAIEQQNILARSKITSDPSFANYEHNLEKSRGKATPPELKSNIGRSQAELAFQTQMGDENFVLDDLASTLEYAKKGDATRAAKDIKTAKKAISSDIARGLQSNTEYAQSVAQDAYSDKVIAPQRERQQRVANTQAEVEGIKAKYGGFQTSPFLSDPLSTANMAADMAGALGDVHSKAQTMTKAQSSLYNPMFSDSEQIMGDAFLRGGGEEYQVDPRFLQVQRQREKDWEKIKKLDPMAEPSFENLGTYRAFANPERLKGSPRASGKLQTKQRPE